MSLNTASTTTVIDCSNLACPEPVLRCREVCKKNPDLKNLVVIVDNPAAKENVTRFLNSQHYEVQVTHEGTKWTIQADRQINPLAPSGQANKDNSMTLGATGQPTAAGKPSEQITEQDKHHSTVVLLTSEFIGQGDDTLGEKLMINFLSTLPELGQELWRIVMLNAGVRLSAQGHQALPKLQALEAAGVEILVCGTCLEYFGILEKKQVGQTTNMLDVVTSLQLAAKVIRP